jgi:hypothetical protein
MRYRTRQCPSWRATPFHRIRRELFFHAIVGVLGVSIRSLRARLSSSSAVGTHGLPQFGMGDRNDGMTESAQKVAERACGSASSCMRRCRFAPVAERRRETDLAFNGVNMPSLCYKPLTARRGTGIGTAVAISRTGRRWGPFRAKNAGSAPSRNPGR